MFPKRTTHCLCGLRGLVNAEPHQLSEIGELGIWELVPQVAIITIGVLDMWTTSSREKLKTWFYCSSTLMETVGDVFISLFRLPGKSLS